MRMMVLESPEAVPDGEDLALLARSRPPSQNPARVYLASLAPGSRRAQATALQTIAHLLSSDRCDLDSLPWESLDYRHLAALRSHLAAQHAPATVNRHLSAVRGVLRECWRLGLMPAETYQRARDVAGVRGSRLPAGRSLERNELTALFRACTDETNPSGALRDAAMLAVLYVTGLRRSELPSLNLDDYDREAGQLRILGKGNKERIGYVLGPAAEALEAWLRRRGPEPGPLFCPVTKGGQIVLRRMTDQAIYDRLRRLSCWAGIKRLSPHDLRRTFISDLLDAVGDLAVAQQLAGHASPATTSRYDRRGERAKRRAVAALTVPYIGNNS